MAQKTLVLLEALLGALAVAALVSVGVDAVRFSRRGSPWRRRLLSGGLALLFLLGLCQALLGEEPAAEKRGDEAAAGHRFDMNVLGPVLEDHPAWNRLSAFVREIHRLAPPGGKVRNLDAHAQGELMDASAKAVRDADSLGRLGLLTRGEAAFFRLEVEDRVGAILAAGRADDPAGGPNGEPPDPAVEAARYFRDRLDLLKKVAADPSTPAVLATLLLELFERRGSLVTRRLGFRSDREALRETRSVRDEVSALMKALRKPASSALGRIPAWNRFLAIRRWAGNLTEEDARAMSDEEREESWAKLEEGERILEGLVRYGHLTEAEAEAVKAEYEEPSRNARAALHRSLALTSSCYTPAPVPCEREITLGAVRERLHLLEKLAVQPRVRPEVLETVLDTLRPEVLKLRRILPAPPPGEPAPETEISRLLERLELLLEKIRKR